MRVIKITSRYGRDFWADMECEFCKHTEKLDSGYDDANYWQNVIPSIKCVSCGKTGAEYKEHLEQKVREDLKEIAHYYGGFDELRKVIVELEDAANEAAWERRMNDH